ncbi:MAG TPA: hypothetical protein VF875_16830 [Anaeromyxobacter sp.]
MPVSKKRKKDGKSVHRSKPVAAGEEHAVHLEEKPAHPDARGGKPTNPFVQQQQSRRASQRGR